MVRGFFEEAEYTRQRMAHGFAAEDTRILYGVYAQNKRKKRKRKRYRRCPTMAAAFVDKARIAVKAGKGGNGAVAFHR